MKGKTLFASSLSTLALLGGLSHEAQAERGRNPLAGQPAIRHRLELRKMRFEITPQFLISTNQAYLQGLGGGANLQFHITDWFGVGASFHYTGAVLSPLGGKVEDGLPFGYDATTASLGQPSKRKFLDHLIGPDMLFAAYASVTPIGGKFSLFSSATAHYDFYFIGGVGFAHLTNPLRCADTSGTPPSGVTVDGNCSSYQPPNPGSDVNVQDSNNLVGLQAAGMLGVGAHIFFNDWVALQFELRDYIFKSNPGGLDVNTTDGGKSGSGVQQFVLSGSDLYITSNLYFGVGLSFFLPPKAKISDKRPETVAYTPTGQKPAEEPAAAPPPKVEEPKVSDRDGDGIPDKEDRCPDEAGPAENQGCPDKDTDGDGIVDRLDKCPDVPGKPPTGCPAEEKKYIVVTAEKIELKEKIQYATGKATINKASHPLLDEVIEVLKSRPKIEVRIEGHTDNKGNAKKNQVLSQERAKSVYDYLMRGGIDAGRLTYQGYGDSKPIADNRTAAGREANRRTEFFIVKQ